MSRIIKAGGGGAFSGAHSDLTGVSADQHHAQNHTLTSHSTRAHSELTGIGATDHHSNANDHASTNDPTANQKAALAGTGTPSGTDKYVNDSDSRMTNSRTPSAHVLDGALHTISGSTAGFVLRVASATTFALARLAHGDLGSVGADDHHAQLHHTAHEPGGGDAMAVDAVAATGSLRTLGTGAQQAAAGTDSRFNDARTPTAHASTHIGSTTGEGSAAVVGTDPTTLISYVVRELIVEDEPFVLDSGKVCIVGSDNTALLWLDSGSQDVRSPVSYVQYQVIVRDEPFDIRPNELVVVGDAGGRASVWCDSNTFWDGLTSGFQSVLDLNADNLFVIASNDVWTVPAYSPLERHIDPVAMDTGALWVR